MFLGTIRNYNADASVMIGEIMKTAIASLALIISVSTGYAQNTPPNNEARAEMMASVDKLLTKAERSINNPRKLNDVIHEFRKDAVGVKMTSADRSEITKRLIKIFYAIDESLPNMANKERILEIIGFSDNSPEAHKVFLDVLGRENERYREMALWGIRQSGVHGDDLYEKIKLLERDGKISKIKSLQSLSEANPKRALEEMKTLLKTTQSVKEFSLVGVNLPIGIGDSPEVLDIIVDRYQEFKSKPPSAGDAGYSPERAVSSEILWKYIVIKDGVRLRSALEIIKDKGVCDHKDLPILEQKIKSHNRITREAVTDFLDSQFRSGNLKQNELLPIIREAYGIESDQKIKNKQKALIENLGI